MRKIETYKRVKKEGEWVGELFWIGGIGVGKMDTGTGPSLLESPDTDDFISRLTLSNNLSYNLLMYST